MRGPGGGLDGVPDAGEVGDGGASGMEDGAGTDADGNGLGDAGLGIELHLEDGKAGVGVVELASEEAVLLVSGGGGGGGAKEEGLEVGDSLQGGCSRVQAFGFVVGEDFLWGW